jgi:lipopolysaccharide/colanic/teichoic acid biosynthesis glycosyltransferase
MTGTSNVTDASIFRNDVQLHAINRSVPWNYLRLRRFVEILIILLSGPVLLVVMFLIAIIIWLEDRRRVFFIQERPGRHGIIFKLYKFRTMYVGSDEKLIKNQPDRRVTRVGRWLRKYKLDELPQLINVLNGQMSVIGPRPVPVAFYKLYVELIPGYELRHLIAPGITGLAQVELGYTTTVDEEKQKLKFDLDYIHSISLLTDFKIIFRTFFR